MATGGGSALLLPGQYLDVKVLNKLKNFIYPGRLTTLAIHLGFNAAQVAQMTASTPVIEEQVLKILCEWIDRDAITIKDLVEEMVLWTQGKCIDRSVWDELVAKRMDPSLMPDESTFDDPPPDSLRLPPETDTLQPHLPGATNYYVLQNIHYHGHQMAPLSRSGAPLNLRAITEGVPADVQLGQEQAEIIYSQNEASPQNEASRQNEATLPQASGRSAAPDVSSSEDVHSNQISPSGQFTSPSTSSGGQFTAPPVLPSGQACVTQYSSEALRERTKDLQGRLYDSLQRQWKNSITLDWLRGGESFSTQEYYVGLRWKRRVNRVSGSQHQELKTMHDILRIGTCGKSDEREQSTDEIYSYTEASNSSFEKSCCTKLMQNILCCRKDVAEIAEVCPNYATNILIEAPPGMGKTCSMAKLALDWDPNSSNISNPVNQFDYVFLLKLRDVDKDPSLPELIIKQHCKLENDDKEFIHSILKGKTKQRVLLLLDGYDEYTPGTNKEIDKAIEDTVGDCFLILTSRPGSDSGNRTYIYVSEKIRKQMDGEVIIEGFDVESIKKASTKYLKSAEKSAAMLQQARQVGIYELLKVPIILLFVCLVYSEQDRLPATRTQIYSKVFSTTVDRGVLRTGAVKEEELETLLAGLGELAWEALQSDIKQLLIRKDELQEKAPEILKLGLLFEVGVERASLTAQPTYVSFQHKSLQEFAAAKYITHTLKQAEDKKVKLQELFPSKDVINKQREVVDFWAGLEMDPEILNHFCVKYFQSLDVSYLIYISRESGIKTFFQDLVKKLLEQKPELDLLNKDVNGSLSVILPSDSPIQSLEGLDLRSTELNESDVQHLGGIIRDNKLPALKHLDLYDNTLTGLLPELLPSDASLPSLEELDLANKEINESDVQHLGGIIRDNKLPALKHLNLGRNTLTGLLPKLLPPDVSLPPLEELILWNTRLNESDAKHLGGIIRDNKLPALKHLNLMYNTLTGLLPELLPSDASLPPLERLVLEWTELNESDVQHLERIIRNNKLPALSVLDLSYNELSNPEVVVGELIEACVTHHQKKLHLFLHGNKLSKKFNARWWRRCKGTNVHLMI